ncbi:MAG: VOC family protein [Phenylobacterium sp.]|nr:MAG: VOC family protein [Phenylobacterium sp.]
MGYITLGALDVEGALPFYDAVLGVLGYRRGPLAGDWVFYAKDGAPGICLCKPFDGQPARGGNGAMIAFKADSHDLVKAAYAAALARGGTDEGPPDHRPPEAINGFYGAYFRDAAGNKLCVFTGV